MSLDGLTETKVRLDVGSWKLNTHQMDGRKHGIQPESFINNYYTELKNAERWVSQTIKQCERFKTASHQPTPCNLNLAHPTVYITLHLSSEGCL
jgi:hypothetical protein